WDHCFGDGGVANKTFACNSNNGVETLVVGFRLGANAAQVTGEQVAIDLASSGATLPVWWQMKNTGTCRPTSLNFHAIFDPLATPCVEWTQGLSSGGIASYTIGVLGANTARIVAVDAVPVDGQADLVAGVEYYGFNIAINHAKTVGAGACGGCATPVC